MWALVGRFMNRPEIGGAEMTAVLPDQPQQRIGGEDLKREVGFLGLLWASEGSIMGSGWLFAALLALTIAGPGALVAWVIASIIVIVIALVYAELGGMFPVSGGGGLFPQYAFGNLAGASFGWFAYVQAAAYAPIEVLVALEYMSTAEWAKGSTTRATAPSQVKG